MSDIVTGARASLYVGTTKIATCTGVTVTQEIMTEPFEPRLINEGRSRCCTSRCGEVTFPGGASYRPIRRFAEFFR